MQRVLNHDRLRAEIMRRGLHQTQFARLAGISSTTISRACSGGTIDPATFRKIVEALARIPVLVGAADLVAV
jgi:transcriptional regulator with XRE-family HTH domain